MCINMVSVAKLHWQPSNSILLTLQFDSWDASNLLLHISMGCSPSFMLPLFYPLLSAVTHFYGTLVHV